MNNKNLILITGASSFLGKSLINKLLEKYCAPIVLTCRNKELCNEWNKNKNVFIEEADLLSNISFQHIFKKYRPDTVIHLAAIARLADGEKEPETAFEINFWGTIEIIKLCKKYGTHTFIFTSSDLARNAISTVGISKYLVERVILENRQETLRMIGIRIANLIDCTGSVTLIFKKQIAEGKKITITHPEMSRRFSTREETAEDIIWLLKNGFNSSIYIVNKPAIKIVNLAKQLMKKAGKNYGIQFIGAKPEEKLSEPSYDEYAIKPVINRQIALLDSKNYKSENIYDFINRLKIKDKKKVKIFFTQYGWKGNE